MPWLGMLVKADGYVYPCCCLLNPQTRPMGNIHASGLPSIWRNGAFRRMRRNMWALHEAVRKRDEARIGALPLPAPCKAHGICFLKSLPYLEDPQFCQEMDSWLRGGEEADIRFPESLQDSQWSTITGRVGRILPWKRIQGPHVRIDGVSVGGAAQASGGFSFGFLPNFLCAGFHLLEVLDAHGRLLKAKVVEKTR